MARVLFIESDRLFGANAKAVLKRAGHRVDWQVDLQSAMNSADSALPDVIILDLLLASRSGVEFLYELRSYPDWADVPVIIYSNIAREEFNEAGVGFNDLNIAAYHHKPSTSLVQLCQSAERVLKPTTG